MFLVSGGRGATTWGGGGLAQGLDGGGGDDISRRAGHSHRYLGSENEGMGRYLAHKIVFYGAFGVLFVVATDSQRGGVRGGEEEEDP